MIVLLIFGVHNYVFSQKINVDSLLTETNNTLRISNSNTAIAKKMALKGIQLSPNYLDFYVTLGRIHKIEKNKDSAQYYFNYVIQKNTKYKEPFEYLSKLLLDHNEYEKALLTIDNAIAIHPNEESFYNLKLQILQAQEKPTKTIEFLNELVKKYPENEQYNQILIEEKSKIKNNRIGISYNATFFDRDNYGPWHLSSISYLRQFYKVAVGGRISYLDRHRNGQSDSFGYFYEIETYFKTTKKSYSFANIGVSNSKIFPKYRFLYSYYLMLGKGFETEIGYRLNIRDNTNSSSGILALGKYFGSSWLNFRTSFQLDEPKLYPSTSIQYRYYTQSTRFDFFAFNVGYGTSPDERETLSQFEERLTLSSYRFGASYGKLIAQKYALAFSSSYNRQEYFPEKFQKEFNFSVNFTYLF